MPILGNSSMFTSRDDISFMLTDTRRFRPCLRYQGGLVAFDPFTTAVPFGDEHLLTIIVIRSETGLQY